MKSGTRRTGIFALALLFGMSLAVVSAAVTLPLAPSSQIPAASGKAGIHRTKNGNFEIRLNLKHLAPPDRIIPGANVFMVWVRALGPDALPQNLGALRVDKNLNGRMTAITALPSFELFLTCEPSQSVVAPSGPELLPLRFVAR